MLARLRARLSYANVVATLALFIALGGSSYAALNITGRDVRNGSLTGKDIKGNTLGGRQVREGRLGTVPRARDARRVGGLSAQQLLLKCPDGTLPFADTCFETQVRSAAPYGSAVLTCGTVEAATGPGRRLPTHGELQQALTSDQVQLAAGGELTSEVLPSSGQAGRVDVLYMTSELGAVAITSDTAEGAKAYRCVADPLN